MENSSGSPTMASLTLLTTQLSWPGSRPCTSRWRLSEVQQEKLGKRAGSAGPSTGRDGPQAGAGQRAHTRSLKRYGQTERGHDELDAKKESTVSRDELADIEGELGAIQDGLGALQGEMGAKQGEFGALQGKLGEQQGKLGAEQGRLGAEQGRIAAEADRTVRGIIDDSLRNGKRGQ